MIDNKLKVIDFSAAVQSGVLNQNFNCIHGWMQRERLRTSGYGLVEGFDMTYPGNFHVAISEGILIDKHGDEIMTEDADIDCGAPAYEQIEERLVVDAEGNLKLKFTPYSPSGLGLITYDFPEHTIRPGREEFSVQLADTLQYINPLSIVGNKIKVPATEQTVGQAVVVRYFYCDDRIDAFMIDEEGNYSQEIGINSDSPSAANVELDDRFLIGFAHWMVGDTITVEFIIDERTYRKVYVDKLNRLYLNGKLYKEPKWIYFVEPQNPEENDVWYDYKTNTLNLWSKNNGIWGWRIMNDFTNVPLREVKMWIPGQNYPKDGRTFLFDSDQEMNYRYIPNTNAVEVIIDQQVVMSDQYTEVVQEGAKPYLAAGIGFKLAEPLDRPTVVQCIVHHNVRNAPLKNVFQRAAIFVAENYITYTASNTQKVFETDLPYVIGANQLEVFVDGKRLNKTTDFIEMKDGNTPAQSADNDTATKFFRVVTNLSPNQRVTYKISRYVWSYDQLNTMMEEIEQKAIHAQNDVDALKQVVQTLTDNSASKIQALESRVAALEKQTATLKDYRKTATKITLNDLNADVRASLVKNNEVITFNASNTDNVIQDVQASDFLIVFCVNDAGAIQLKADEDYTLTYNGDDATIDVRGDLMSPDNNLYVSVIRLGR